MRILLDECAPPRGTQFVILAPDSLLPVPFAIYSVYRTHEVQYYSRLIPCFNAAHRYPLLSLPCSLFPVPCSLKSRNCVPHKS
ncbi:MAG: hypothetical protein F6K55_21110 [Moorea sp. SIO4A3]|nr:hypothetical protein [Moorena sp. SIO4A3]